MATITINTELTNIVGENILATIVEGKLILIIDTTQEIGLSSTGKTMGVGSSSGFKPLPGNLTGNIYVGKKYRPA